MVTSDVVTRVYDTFKQKNVALSRIWLDDCLRFLEGRGNTSLADVDTISLCDEVFEQFIHSDMRTSVERSSFQLPENASELHKTSLSSSTILQVEHIVDITKDPNEQAGSEHSRLHEDDEDGDGSDFEGETGEDAGFTEWKDMQEIYSKSPVKSSSSANRMLAMVLSDGFTKILGVEHKPISAMKVDTRIGVKVRISNPMIRRGIMLLDSSNFEVLGGFFIDKKNDSADSAAAGSGNAGGNVVVADSFQ